MVDNDLYPFQEIGASWLTAARFRLLADDMGLGKSAQAVTACDLIEAGRILIVCPATACENWTREFQKFSSRHPGSYHLSVVSYDMLVRNLDKYTRGRWDVLICDEGHYLKEPSAQRTRAVFGNKGICRFADYFWILTGTPAPNHAAELWVMLYSFGRTTLTYENFISQYCNTKQVANFRRQILGTKVDKIAEMRELLKPVILRRTKAEVKIDLPSITFSDWVVEKSVASFPDDLRKKLEAEFAILSERLELLDMTAPDSEEELLLLLEGMAPSVSTLRRYNGIQKAQAVGLTLSQELTDGAYKKIVIFAVHHDVVSLLAKHFKNPAIVTGQTPVRKRQAEVDRFQNDPHCQVFIGNVKAAGVAITLTAAHHEVFVEQEWVPGHNAQAAMRCHRIGQENPVNVRFVSIANSFDERITAVLRKKTRELSLLFDPVMH